MLEALQCPAPGPLQLPVPVLRLVVGEKQFVRSGIVMTLLVSVLLACRCQALPPMARWLSIVLLAPTLQVTLWSKLVLLAPYYALLCLALWLLIVLLAPIPQVTRWLELGLPARRCYVLLHMARWLLIVLLAPIF